TFFFHPNLRKMLICSFGEFIHCILTHTDDAKVQVMRNFDQNVPTKRNEINVLVTQIYWIIQHFIH
ncbi:MAG: hypothetical protein ORN53_02595, partial [Crocinitomicaceae bacterium]|nr:hypothetical protein [Crocinitomicaceae bacterium]